MRGSEENKGGGVPNTRPLPSSHRSVLLSLLLFLFVLLLFVLFLLFLVV